MTANKEKQIKSWSKESTILINALFIAIIILIHSFVADSVLAVSGLALLFLGMIRMVASQVPVKWLFRGMLVFFVVDVIYFSTINKNNHTITYVECAIIDKKWEKVGKGFYRDYYCSFILCKSQKRSKLDLTDDTYKSLKVGDTLVVAYSSLDKEWKLDEWDFLGAYPCKSNGITQRKKCFLYPVVFMDGLEFGNDYYYYAKLRPDLSLKNFGLNKIILGIDSLLYYKNINKDLDSAWYQCSKGLQTKQYQTLVDTADAFYFHGEIIPAEQLFSEIPQAKEYYDKYNKN